MNWQVVLKRASKFEAAIAEEFAGEDMSRGRMKRHIAYQKAYRQGGYAPSEKTIREKMEEVSEADIDTYLERRRNKFTEENA